MDGMGARYLLEKERWDALRKVPRYIRKDARLLFGIVQRMERGDGMWDVDSIIGC